MKKIITIIGARPQFIKAAAMSKTITESSDFEEITIHTGQHYDENMSEIFFKQMNIPQPKYRLNINNLSHGAMTGQMLSEIEKILQAERPGMVIIYGDTNSTLAGALAASKLHIPIAHIEAGLRSFNMAMPEEVNRIVSDRLSSVLFCPTETAVQNLKTEGFDNFQCKIYNVGDIMYESALLFAELSDRIQSENTGNYILATIHRQENTDDLTRLSNIIHALNEINKNTKVVSPLHPRTAKIIEREKLKPDFKIINPVGYFEMLQLINSADIIMTDSGGLQKEAFFFDKHCIVMRDETEWTELVEHGYNCLVGADRELIINKTFEFLGSSFHKKHTFFGEGNTSKLILDHIRAFVAQKK